jgi:hypothetical protein
MPEELPIACSLSATDLTIRLAQMRELGGDALLDARNDGLHAQLRFVAGVGVRERVEAVVVAESHCCAFLTMQVTDEPDTLVLTIDAPEGGEVVLAALVDAFAADPAAA